MVTETTTRSIPLADVVVDEELLAAAHEALASGWWSTGPRVETFEAACAEFFGVEHAVAVSNGTAALHLALLACECGPGDEVVLPSLTFVAAANVVRHAGAVPVFCDIRGPEDLNLDPEDAEAAVGPRTKALLLLHYGGFPCDMDAVTAIAERHGLVLIEDAAHAPGSTWRGRMCGTLGRVGCFSFFSNKNLPVGEGGLCVTNDDDVAERLRHLRSHGMTSLTWDRHRGHAHAYDVVAPGFNYRLDEVRAAVGLVQLGRLEERNAARARIVERYRERLRGVEGLVFPFSEASPDEVYAHHLAAVLLPEGVGRPGVQEAMRSRGVQTSVHYPPIHHFSAYADAPTRPLPATEDVAGRLLSLPLYPHMTEDDVEGVGEALVTALARTGSAAR